MIDATRTRATSLRPCFLTLLCSFSSIRITVSHFFDARLQPLCSCPCWKRNLNDTCLECSPLGIALRKSCADEKEIASFVHNSRIFIKYDWFLLVYLHFSSTSLVYIISFNFLIVENIWNDRIQYAAYRFIKIPLHTPKTFLTVRAIVQSRTNPTNDSPLIDKKRGFFFRQSIFIPVSRIAANIELQRCYKNHHNYNLKNDVSAAFGEKRAFQG